MTIFAEILKVLGIGSICLAIGSWSSAPVGFLVFGLSVLGLVLGARRRALGKPGIFVK
jgi:hypothetical protein